MTARALLLALLSSVAAAPATGLAQPSGTAGADTRLFAMQSNFWVNLHHFLYVASRARRGLDATRTAVTNALADTAGFGALTRQARDGWQSALDHYSNAIAERDVVFDSALAVAAASLSHLTNQQSPRGVAGVDSAMARALDQAAPAYRVAWWPRHDASNRAWIAAVRPLLVQHGDSAAAWETRAFGVTWPRDPVRVDVTAYTNWSGAYTTEDPDRVTMASLNEDTKGTAAFETLFHEVLHTMDRPLFEQFREAARAQGKRMPRNPTHPFIFYTAGEVSRRLLRNHVPYAEETGLWARSRDWGPMRALLQKHWQPWLDGRISFDEALRRIAAEL